MRRKTDSSLIVSNNREAKARFVPRARPLRSATALASGLLALAMFAAPAAAQQTSGGNGGGPNGGAGGASSSTTTGGAGGNGVATGGGGGGGAGSSGGSGGTGENSGGVLPGGAGGVGPGGNGSDGQSGGFYGAGGGGGAHGYVGETLPVNAASGGRGGWGGQGGPYGGGAGAGGYGAVVTIGANLGTLSVSVTGGAGGIGGFGVTNSGFGGPGGHGLFLTAPSTLIVGASVTGGNGGAQFSGSPVGVGGYGIVGGGLDLTLNAAVSGGFDGDGTARGFSLYFTGGANNLTLGSGWGLAGGIFIAGGSLTLSPSNDLTLANDVSGSGSFAHTGFGTLILTGTNTYAGGTTIGTSTLQIGAGGTTGTLGGGNVVNDGALVFNRSDDFTVSNDISGTGSLTKIGAGTLSLTGSNSYSGTTSILSGTLAVNATGLGSSQLIEIGNGATLRALTGFGIGAFSILDGGGTIDTNGAFRVVSISGDVDYGGLLTVTGGGILFIDDVSGTGSGGIDVANGTLALGGDLSAGEGLIRLANGTTLENAAFGCGCNSLYLANNIEVEVGGTATINGFGRYTVLDGQLSGGNFRFINGSQGSEGPGTVAVFELTGANSYGSTFIGADTGVVLTGAGTLGAGDVTFDSAPSNPSNSFVPGLVFANDQDYGFEGAIIGNGFVIVDPFDPATTISLYGSNTSGNNFTGTIIVANGRLNIEGNVGDIDNLSASLIVGGCGCSDATLGGSGTFFGSIDFLTGTLAAGSSPGTLNIAGNLTLGAGTVLNFELGQPGVVGNSVNDFVTVGGNLTLDGTLNVIDFGPSYGPGYYALFRYGGTLTDNTLDIGTIVGGLSTSILTNISGQVNLLLGPQVIQYWDGADTTGVASGSGTLNGDGGAGTWSATNTNWTAASGFGVNDQWRSTVGIFAGAVGGTVMVDGTQSFQELRFQTDGYLLRPAGFFDRLTTTGGFSIVQVDPGLTADIGVQIGGAAGLTKTGTGTLILSASNSYAGATNITAGTLRMGDAFVLPSTTAVTVAAGATLDLGAFNQQFGSLAGAGSVLGAGGFDTGGDNSSTTFSGTIDVGGFVSKQGTGNWTLTGVNSVLDLSLYDGTVTIAGPSVLNGAVTVYGFAGTPTLINDGTINGRLIAYGGNTDNNGTINGFIENRTTTFVNDGTITGTGFYTLFNIFGGVFTNNGLIEGRVQNAEFGGGGTLINAGTITGFLENVAGGIVNSTGTINGVFQNRGTAFLRGQMNGSLTNFGTATATLTGTTTGITSYNGQPGGVALDLAGFNTAIDAISGEGQIRLGSAFLTIGANDAFSVFSGVISGSGGLTKVGNSVAFLFGANTYTGLTTVNAGTLSLSSTGRISGNVLNNATFNNDGRVDLIVTSNGTATNTGLIAGGVVNSGNFNSSGTIEVGLLNNAGATMFTSGSINGFIDNRGTFNAASVTGIADFVQAATGIFNLTTSSIAVGGLGGAGVINLAANILTVGGSNFSGDFSGVINGSGGLTKVGTGVLTLSGVNTYTGLTKVDNGFLVVAATGRISGPVENNFVLDNRGTIAGQVVNNAIGGALNSGTMSGGLINFGAFQSFTPASVVSGGVVNFGNAQFQGQLNGAVDNRTGGIIAITGATTGIGRVDQSAGALFNLQGFSTSFGALAGAGEVRLGGAALTVGGDNSSTTFAGIVTGTGASGLTKVGTGTLTLSGANTYTGLTTVNAGTLSLASTGRLALLLNNANAINAGIIGAVENRAGATFTNSGTVTNGVVNAGTMSSTGIIGLGMNNGGAAQLRGQLNGFVNNNAGTITLTGALTGITAFTQAAGATLNLNGFSLTLGSLSGAGSITFGGAAPAGGLEPATAQSIELQTAVAAVTRAGLVPGGQFGGNGETQRVTESVATAASRPAPAPASEIIVAPSTPPSWLVADTAAPAQAGNLASAAGTGRAAAFGLVPTETAMAAAPPGAGMEVVESPMARAGSNALGGNGDTVSIADNAEAPAPASTAVADTSGALVVNLSGGGDTVRVVSEAPAAPVMLTAGGSILTPQALPPASGPVLTIGGDNSSTLFSGVISGNGRLAKVGTGTLILTGTNTYTDGTLISGGALQLGNGGTSGSIVGRIENNAVLIVNRSDALTLAGIIDGTGLFVQAGTGTTTLTGVNAYTGGTLIQAGRLRGDALSIQGDIQNNATLEFAQATTGTFAGRLFGAGLVEKTGAGLLTYTTDNSNLTGETRILGGELRVNGLLSRSRVTVGNTATLSGTSVVGGFIAQSGGTVAPGSGGFGTLGVNGNIQFLAGSTYVSQVQPAGSDLILGNGNAQLAGTIAIANAGGVYRFNSIYVLLQADGGRTGTFGTETGLNTFGQAYAPRIVYTPTQVQLLLAPNQLLVIAGPDGTPNQRSTLTRIDAAVAAGYDPQPLIALYNLTPRAAFLNGADQLSGEIYATGTRVALDDERLVREATFGRLRLTQDMGLGQGFGAWGHAVGSWGSGDTDGNAARYERDQRGFVVGIDGGGNWDRGGWRVGLLGHHLSTDISVDARGSNAEIERSGAGAYVGLDFDGVRIQAGGTWSSLELEGRRVAAFTGFTETLTGETDGEALQGFAEIAYRFQVGASTHVEPYFQASHTRVEFDAFSETGGASRLRVAAEEDDLTTLIFGLRGGTVMPIGANTNLRLDGGVGARHLSGDRMIFSLISLDVSPNQAFDIRSAALDRLAVTGNADATFEFGRMVSLTVGYSGVISSNARDHALRATLGLRF